MHRLTCTALGYKLLFALVLAALFGLFSSEAADLATIHLAGKIARDAEVGLAVLAPERLYAAYWVESKRRQPWQIVVYEFNVRTGKVVAQSELDKAEPLRSRDGDVIQTSVRLSTSPDGSMLLCTTLEGGPLRKVWTLSSDDLHVLSGRSISSDENLLGFTRNGDVRLLRIQSGGTFGQEIDSATVLDLSASSLDKVVSERTVRFQEPVWRLIAVGADDLLWALDERPSSDREPRIAVYKLESGELIATHDVSLSEAQVGAPSTEPRPRGSALPAPTSIPQPGLSLDAPQLAQMMGTSQAVLGVIHQSAKQWKAWSRLVRIGVSRKQVAWSSIVSDCNLLLDSIDRSGKMVVGTCDLVGRSELDQYAIKKSDAVFISTDTGSIVAVVPLNTRMSSLSFAIDATEGPAVAAIYDRPATVRVLSVPRK